MRPTSTIIITIIPTVTITITITITITTASDDVWTYVPALGLLPKHESGAKVGLRLGKTSAAPPLLQVHVHFTTMACKHAAHQHEGFITSTQGDWKDSLLAGRRHVVARKLLQI